MGAGQGGFSELLLIFVLWWKAPPGLMSKQKPLTLAHLSPLHAALSRLAKSESLSILFSVQQICINFDSKAMEMACAIESERQASSGVIHHTHICKQMHWQSRLGKAIHRG